MLTTVTEVDVPGDQQLTLIGTAHVSQESADEVRRVLNEKQPDVAGIEVGMQRYRSLLRQIHGHDRESDRSSSLFKRAQEKIGRKFGVRPGVEAREAITVARQIDCIVAPIDQSFERTQKQLREQMGWLEVGRMLFGIARVLIQDMGSLPDLDDVEEQIDEQGGMEGILDRMSKTFPGLYNVLVTNRNEYMTHRLKTLLNRGHNVVATVGSAHVSGIQEHLEEGVDAT